MPINIGVYIFENGKIRMFAEEPFLFYNKQLGELNPIFFISSKIIYFLTNNTIIEFYKNHQETSQVLLQFLLFECSLFQRYLEHNSFQNCYYIVGICSYYVTYEN